MPQDESAVSFWQALKDRRKVAVKTFAIVLLVAGAVAFVTRQYAATAVVGLNPAGMTGPDGQPRSTVERAWSVLTDKRIAQIIQQFQLDTELTKLRAQGQVFTYLRSNISLNEIIPPGSSLAEVAITYTGDSETKTIQAANALAQVLTGEGETSATTSQHGTTNLSDELARARSNLELLEQSQHPTVTEADVQKHLRTDATLKAALEKTTESLAALKQESEQTLAAATKPPRPQPDPQRLALEQQIREAQGHLSALRERYTDQYPDVQESREALAQLQARLDRIPADKPEATPPTAASAQTERRIVKERDRLEATAQDLKRRIQENEEQAQVLRNRMATEKAMAQDYAWEQQHYNALLQEQQAAQQEEAGTQQPAGGGSAFGIGGSSPPFIVVKNATGSEPLGLFTKPVFWIGSLVVALLAAGFAVFLAEQFIPLDEENGPASLRIT